MESRGMRVRGSAIALAVSLLWNMASASATAGGINIYWGLITKEASLAETCASGNFDIVMVSYLMINSKRDTSSLNVANHSSIKVFMSLYGVLEDEEHTQKLAKYVWENFLGGE